MNWCGRSSNRPGKFWNLAKVAFIRCCTGWRRTSFWRPGAKRSTAAAEWSTAPRLRVANGWPAALQLGEALWGQSIKFCWENMMQNQQLREQLAAKLRRQSLPARYVERLLAEWDDHLADLQDERNAEMNRAQTPESKTYELQTADILDLQQRLGDPAQLATFA